MLLPLLLVSVWASGSGEQIYRERCAVCHEGAGMGVLALRARLGDRGAFLRKRKALDPDFVRQVVREGFLSMPAMTPVEVSDVHLDSLVKHLCDPK